MQQQHNYLKTLILTCAITVFSINLFSCQTLSLDISPELKTIPDSHFVSINNLNIHYLDMGAVDAPTVLVFIHGWAGMCMEIQPMAEMLIPGGNFRIFAPDLPGSGYSDRPVKSLGMTGYTLFVADWLDFVRTSIRRPDGSLPRIILMAHSMGAHVSLRALKNFRFDPQPFPEIDRSESFRDIDRVVLFAPDGMKGEEGPLIGFRNHDFLHTVLGFATPGLHALINRGYTYANPQRSPPLLVKLQAESLFYKQGRDALVDITMDTLTNQPLDGQLGNLDIPMLMFWGKQDNTLNFKYSPQFVAGLPNVEFHAFENCGHSVHIEMKDAIVPVLLGFLQKDFSQNIVTPHVDQPVLQQN